MKIIIGAPIKKLQVVTILERFNIICVKAGRLAPRPANIDSNFGTIKTRRPRLTEIAKTSINMG